MAPALQVGQNRLVASDPPHRQRYLVRHDYGMGASWWWINAGSAAEITAAIAEVEVIDDPDIVRRVESWPLDELDFADAIRGPLADLISSGSGSAKTQRLASFWARAASTCGCLILTGSRPGG